MISWNRKKELNDVLYNLRKDLECYDVEFLIADQGSTDGSVEFLRNFNPSYLRLNTKNEGVAHTFNQLYLRAKGDVVCLFGNDILMPKDWVHEAIKYLEAVPNCGLIGTNWGHGSVPPITRRFGVNAHFLNNTGDRIFGNWIVPRRVIEEVGLFDERFIGYGLEDSDMNERVNRAGFNSFYLPNLKSSHLCNDVGNGSEYRKMKDHYMGINMNTLGELIKSYDAGGPIKAQLPGAKEPI